METTKALPKTKSADVKKKRRQQILHRIRMDKWLYILMIPGLLHILIFKYAPMYGVLIAFKDYNPYTGFFESQWVGFKHFIQFFNSANFKNLFVNTLWISLLNIGLSFPAPIILAVLINELHLPRAKKLIQTCVYIPHFLSWVIVVSLTSTIFSMDGVINRVLEANGMESIQFLTSNELFRPMIIGQTIWKSAGWGTIVFLAAMAGVDLQLYEAAIVDGATRFQQVWHITLPAIRGTIVIMLILRLGSVLDTGFEQIYLMSNALNRSVSETFDTYVYISGITQGSFSMATAVGLFKSVIGIILIFGSNALAKKAGDSGIF